MQTSLKLLAFGALGSLPLTACGAGLAPATAMATAPAAQAVALFRIVKPDGAELGITLSDLHGLPAAQITVDGRVEDGPRLSDVLKLAGVTEFSEVTLTGSASPITLTRAQVDDNTILDFTNRGTMKLATTHVAKPDWTKDITLVTVK